MSGPDALSRVFWQDELEYARSFDWAAPGERFNDSPVLYARYCSAAAAGADNDGHHGIANDFRNLAAAALLFNQQEEGK